MVATLDQLLCVCHSISLHVHLSFWQAHGHVIHVEDWVDLEYGQRQGRLSVVAQWMRRRGESGSRMRSDGATDPSLPIIPATR